MRRVTRPIAVSRRIPVASPASSRSISPPAGALVSGPIPAIRRAAVLHVRMWPQVRVDGDRPIRNRRVEVRSLRRAPLDQTRLVVAAAEEPLRLRAAVAFASRSRARRSGRLRAPRRSTSVVSRWPIFQMCAWASMNPGTTVRRPRSIRRVAGPADARTSSARPTDTIRPARTASASAAGCPASCVSRTPLWTTRSGTGGVTAPSRPAGASHRHARWRPR